MVTLTIRIDDGTAARLEQEAKERGTTVDELLAAGAHLLLDARTHLGGELISHEAMMRKLHALRG